MPDDMDQEVKEIASLELRNAFWREFSGLVNAYEAAAAGLHANPDDFAYMLGELTSVFGVDQSAESLGSPVIYANTPKSRKGLCATMLEALEHPTATAIFVNSRLVLVKAADGWRCPA